MSSSQLKRWTKKEKKPLRFTKGLWPTFGRVDSFPTEGRFETYVAGKISPRLTLLKVPRCVPLTGHTCDLPATCSRCQSRKTCPPSTAVPFRRRSCVRGTRICKDANDVPSRTRQQQTARRQSCSTFLQKTLFRAAGIWHNGCLKNAVYLSNAPFSFLLICMRNGGKKQLGKDSYLLPLQGCRDYTPTCWKWRRIRQLLSGALSQTTRLTRWAGKGCRAGWIIE